MVTLVEFDNREIKGRIRRFFARNFGKKVTFSGERIGGVPYCLVRVRKEGPVPWEEVGQAVGRGGRVVFERGMTLPVGLEIDRVDGEPLRRKILLNGAVWTLEQAAVQAEVGDAALLDRFGRFSDAVPRLMQACRTLTVVTSDLKGYRALADGLSSVMGAAPMITELASGLSGCSAVIAPDGLIGFGAIEKPRLLFTADSRGGCTLDDGCVRSPFDDKTVEKYGLFELLTVFRSEGAFSDVASILPHSVVMEGKTVPLQQLSRCFGT